MKKVILIALLSVFVVNVSMMAKEAAPAKKAETAVVTSVSEIKGMVFDKSTKETLAGASVLINGKKVYTDLDGNFTIPATTGKCELKISMISYEDKVMTVNLNGQSSLKIELNQR
ncbi:MAG: carboxypeptidase-like regulatory domain-containing protein [Bacteroidales bacterium]|jgi:hypothetical protein|nr:MAG: carboxypeptidase-like regulatory domain-containing protein [Paludibacter sp.]MCE1154687.1 carboxypeptidase-like regulatory domain-containing protein [Bacteroidales bacterium]OJX88451.1 MAG: hypothetical protein BGP01_08865 [Paludibacter sp. 47-17]